MIQANSGTAAISLILSNKLDMLILDLRMPQPDGLTILSFLRPTNPRLLRRTLVVTGMQYDRKTMGVLETLHIPFLLKPFHIDDLVEAASRIAKTGNTRAGIWKRRPSLNKGA